MADARRWSATTRSTTPSRAIERVLAELAELDHTELLDFGRLAELLGYDRKIEHARLPRHPARLPRAWLGVPRLPRLVAQKVIHQFGDLEDRCWPPRRRSWRRSRGWGTTRAKEIREGLRRLQEVDIVDRYR